eukprot:scaffold20725_cov111-Isochrysis_galbana.AAC.9
MRAGAGWCQLSGWAVAIDSSEPAVLPHHPVKSDAGLLLRVVGGDAQVEPGAADQHVGPDAQEDRLHRHGRRPALVGEHLGANGAADCDVAGAEGEARADHADVWGGRREGRREADR